MELKQSYVASNSWPFPIIVWLVPELPSPPFALCSLIIRSKKLDKKVEDLQEKSSGSAEKIQQMQSAMQQAAAEAARAVAQQHSQQSS